MLVTLDHIRAARQRIREFIYHSPCPYSLSLSRLCGCDIYCKLDHLQMTGSFKERGARNKLMLLTEEERTRGIVAASAGNHALALAYHGAELKVAVTVVMPKWAPLVKVNSCRSFGAEIILHGESYDEARKHARELSEARQCAYVPGFDDPDIIAGQGTLGLEILEDVPDADAVIVPIGGGGLIAGVGTAIKSLRPDVRLIGVEPENAPTYVESCRRGEVVRIETKPTLADGLAVAEVGKLCFAIARQVVNEVRLVTEAEIARAVLKLLELEKTVVEGAGAVPLAAAVDPALDLSGKKVVLLLSGGNIDTTIISRVIERGLAAEGRLCRIVAQISDRPGSMARLTRLLGATGASIKEIDHDRNFGPADIAMVNVVFVLETRDQSHVAEVQKALSDSGISFEMR